MVEKIACLVSTARSVNHDSVKLDKYPNEPSLINTVYVVERVFDQKTEDTSISNKIENANDDCKDEFSGIKMTCAPESI